MKKGQSKHGKSVLKPEDSRLWKRVADTTTPLSPKRGAQLQDELKRLLKQAPERNSEPHFPVSAKPAQQRFPNETVSAGRPPAPSQPHRSNPIEERVLKKLARGRQSIDGRLDLHGMTQDRARFALLEFLEHAQRSDRRIVLIITGKGNQGLGILRRQVPLWLAAPPFSQYINGTEPAHVSHGGDGALYVRIRKPQPKVRS